MRSLLALLCLVLSAGPGLGRTPRAAEVEWTQVETPHLRLYSSVRDSKTREVGRGVELLRGALEVLFPPLGEAPEDPLTVFLFRDEGEYRPYRRALGGEDDAIRGHLVAHPLGDFVALDAYPPEGAWSQPVAFHEITHAYLESRYPAVPPWLHEGLAEYFSTFQAVGNAVQVGGVHPEHVHTLRRSRFTPWKQILALGATPRGEAAGRFYAQSWLLVHFLRHREDGNADPVRRYLEALAAGRDSGEAFREIFRLDPGSLKTPLRAYLNRSRFTMEDLLRSELPPVPEIAVRPVAPGEILYRLGLLLALGGGADGAAAEHFEAAIRAGKPDARGGLAFLLEDRDPAAAEEEYRTALAAGGEDPLTFHLYGRWMVRRLRGEVPGPTPDPERAREILTRAVELDPEDPRSRALLGTTWLFTDDPAQRGIGHLRAARRARPGHAPTLFNLAMLYLKDGRVEEAERLVEGPLAATGSPLAERAARELRRKSLETRVNRALRDRRPEEARRLVEEAREDGGGLRAEELDRWLERIGAQTRRQQETAVYNQAVTYANFGEWEEVVEILTPLVEEGTVPNVVAAARRLLAEAEQQQE